MNIDKLTNDVINETDRIINIYGPRLAGTKASLDTANELYNDATKYSDSTHIEEFNINKGAFFGWINLIVIFYVLGLVTLILHKPITTLVLAVLSLLVLYFQFIRYLPIIDFLFPKRAAKNVYGVIEPKLEVKRQVIISGHHDSAPIFNFFVHHPKLYGLRVTGSIMFVVIGLILSIVNIIIVNSLVFYISIGVISLGLLLVLQMWFFKNKKATPGAGDNLASTQVAFQMGKHYYSLKGTKDELKHTRIIFASFDAEEEGLRGARAFVKKNKDMLLATKTYVLNIECLYDKESLFFLTSDINNTVKLSKELASDLVNIGNDLGIKTHMQDIAVLTGGTDAGEFGKYNIEATTIMGMPWSNDNRNMAYHTLNDTIEAVSRDAVSATINIFNEYIRKLD